MTQFRARNVPKPFGMPFLSFPITTTKKMFWWNFDDFSGARHNRHNQSWKPDQYDYVCHPKHTYTICGAVFIVFRQYGWKIIRSTFADFSCVVTTEAEKIENRPCMTAFCTRNILTLFVTQFMSFCDQCGWKMFQSNFDDFFGPEYHHSKQSWKSGPDDCFDNRNIPTLFGTHFLSFLIRSGKDGLRQIFTTFSGPGKTEKEKLKTGPRWLGWAPETYQLFLGCNFYRLASVRQKNVSVEFWRLFRCWSQPAPPKFKIGSRWLRLVPQTYLHNLLCSFYRFPSVRLKNNSVEFCRLSALITNKAGKVENRARLTLFCTWNIPSLFGTLFLSFCD